MKALAEDLESAGLEAVHTYIQSGNVVFRSGARSPGRLASLIRKTTGERHGFTPGVLVLSAKDLERSIRRNPLPVPATARNWRTIRKLEQMAAAAGT